MRSGLPLLAPAGPWPPQSCSASQGLLLRFPYPTTPSSQALFRAELVLIKAPGVVLFCFDRKYIKPRLTESTESGFTTSLGPWLPVA